MNSLGGDKMDKTCGILFSGGLDSSLAVCEMIENGYGAYLFHYDTGALISNNLVDIRYKELKEVYGNKILDMCHYKIGGMFRKLALVSIRPRSPKTFPALAINSSEDVFSVYR